MARKDSTGPYRGFDQMELAMHARRRLALLAMADEKPSRRTRRLLAAAERRARRRYRRAPSEVQPDAARALSHRLGRRAHDRLSRLARSRRKLVRLDELPRSASSLGSAAERGAANELARSRFRPAIPARPTKSKRFSTTSRAIGSTGTTADSPISRAARHFVPCKLTEDQIREINALTHIKNELIDQACGRVLARIAERGWDRAPT